MSTFPAKMLVVGYNVAFLGEEGTASVFDGGGAPGGGANDVPPAEQTGPPNNGAAGPNIGKNISYPRIYPILE
jgi:hypothetical protein